MVSRDGINGVSTRYSSFVPSLAQRKKHIYISALLDRCRKIRRRSGTSHSFPNLRFAQLLCGAQELSEQ
jgi:hypothetical protein